MKSKSHKGQLAVKKKKKENHDFCVKMLVVSGSLCTVLLRNCLLY